LGIQLQNAKNQLGYTRLTAPVSGTIQKVNFEKAEMVSAGLPVFDIVDAGSMEVQISVPADIYAQHHRFVRAYCKHKGEQYELRQTSLLPKADANQLFTLNFALQGSKLSAGQSVDVYIVMSGDGSSEGLTVPPHAVFEDGGKSYVWVVGNDDVVKKQPVTLGTVSVDGDVFVTSGLSETDRVVKAGVNMLHDGEKVKVVVPQTTNIGDLL
jgi:multidrug efflux system membrane fusion protein